MKKVFLFTLGLGACLASIVHAQERVYINEIAWMGSTTSSSNEWMELYNPSNAAVNLNGWKLASLDKKITIALYGQIAAQGFYLLERSDDNSVPNVPADKIYKGTLNNKGQDLLLYDSAGVAVDEANFTGGW